MKMSLTWVNQALVFYTHIIINLKVIKEFDIIVVYYCLIMIESKRFSMKLIQNLF